MSLHRGDWMKILGGLALAATGAGAAGIGPLAGLLSTAGSAGAGAAGAAGGAAAAGAAGAGAGTGFASLVAPSMVGTGLSAMGSGMMGTPQTKMTQPTGAPPMMEQTDPFSILRQIQSMKKGGF